jgi:hypothetical protein
MNPSTAVFLLLSSFVVATALAYRSGRFFPGFICPVLLLFLYLTLASFQATGGRTEGLGLVSGFALALMLMLGLPIAVMSVFGALLGRRLSKRGRAKNE